MTSIIFAPDGTFRAIYDDEIASALREVGPISIRRASHVEPDEAGLWWADMSPVGGGLLGPFDGRTEALEAETVWLVGHNIPFPEAS